MTLFVGFSDDRRSFFPVLILFVFFVLVIIVVRVARRQHVAHDGDEADVEQPGENVLGGRSCGVIITKFSDHVVTFRSSPTVFADTPLPMSASTRILAGKPPRAMSSATMLLHLYRGIGSSLIALPPRRRAA